MTYQLSHYLFVKALVGSRGNPGVGEGCGVKESRSWGLGELWDEELGTRGVVG